MATAIGIDLGGNNVKGVLINEEGEILYRDFQPIAQSDTDNGGSSGTHGIGHQ